MIVVAVFFVSFSPPQQVDNDAAAAAEDDDDWRKTGEDFIRRLVGLFLISSIKNLDLKKIRPESVRKAADFL